jgi:two-component system OmpR family response regulator
MKILYVEDDPTAREYVGKGLLEHGFVVDSVADGQQGLEWALCGAYDLLILDVSLPGRDGFAVLKELRQAGVTTPALFLTARGEVADRIQGLDLGGDDYLTKPFAFAELLARIRAVARRRQLEPPDGLLRIADLVLDVRAHQVTRAGRRLDLTPKEFVLLEYLMRHAEQVVSRTMILEKVWGYGFDSYSNLIDVHINHLRKKIDRDFEPRLIHTVKGMGYLLGARSPMESGARGSARD